MGQKYHIMYLDENDERASTDIAAGDIDEALMLFRRKHEGAFVFLIVCLD